MEMTKVSVNGKSLEDCPKCSADMFGVTVMNSKPFKHYAQCPNCNYKTKAK